MVDHRGCTICGSPLVRQGRSNVWKCSKEGCDGSARDLRSEEDSPPAEVVLKAPKTKAEAKERLKKHKPAIICGDVRNGKYVAMRWRFDTGKLRQSMARAEEQGLEVTAEVVVVCNGEAYQYSLAEFCERLGVEEK